jgi:hypothetical protein
MTSCGVCKGAGAIKGTVGSKRIKKRLTCLACNGTGVQQWEYHACDEKDVRNPLNLSR